MRMNEIIHTVNTKGRLLITESRKTIILDDDPRARERVIEGWKLWIQLSFSRFLPHVKVPSITLILPFSNFQSNQHLTQLSVPWNKRFIAKKNRLHFKYIVRSLSMPFSFALFSRPLDVISFPLQQISAFRIRKTIGRLNTNNVALVEMEKQKNKWINFNIH
jgi:hypothetical protein